RFRHRRRRCDTARRGERRTSLGGASGPGTGGDARGDHRRRRLRDRGPEDGGRAVRRVGRGAIAAGRAVSALIRLDDVTLGYDGSPVLSHVSFAIERGEFAALLGPNGAGK